MDKKLKRAFISAYAFSFALLASCQHSQEAREVFDETNECHIPSYLLNQERELTDDDDIETALVCDIQKPHLLRQDLTASTNNQSLICSQNKIDFHLMENLYFRYDATNKTPRFSLIDNGAIVWDSALLDEAQKDILKLDFDNFQKDLLELKSIKDEFQSYQSPLNQNKLRCNTLEWEYEMRYLITQKRLTEFCTLFYDTSFEMSELEQEDASLSLKLQTHPRALNRVGNVRQKD